MICYGKQDINQSDFNETICFLKSDFLTQGPQFPLFEKIVADYFGARYGVAVNNVTPALYITFLSLGLCKSDWLWTSPNSFVVYA